MAFIMIFTTDLYQGGVAESSFKLAKLLKHKHRILVVTYDSLPISKCYSGEFDHIALNCPLSKGFRKNTSLSLFFSIRRVLYLSLAILKFLRLKVEYRPDIVFSFTYIPNIINILTKKFARSSVVISERQDPRYDLSSQCLMPIIVKFFYKYSDYLHVNSREMVEAVNEFYKLQKSKVIRIDNFFFLNEIKTRALDTQSKNNQKGQFRFVSVNRLADQKGIQHQIKLIASLRKKNFNCSLQIIGDGYLYEKMHEMAKSEALDDVIIFEGHLEDPIPVMSSADFFLFTSLWESFGNVLIEAMALGLPVISTSCSSGPKEIIDTGKYALSIGTFPTDGSLGSEGLYDELADKIIEFCIGLRGVFVERSLIRAEDYSAEVARPKFEGLISRCLQH